MKTAIKTPIRFLHSLALCAIAAMPVSSGAARPENVASASSESAATSAETAPRKMFALDNNAFTFDLYAQLRDKKGNLFFSPFSIASALTMTKGGARGQTAEQMDRVLHQGLRGHTLPGQKGQGVPKAHSQFKEAIDNFNAMTQEGGLQLSIANSIWPQQDYKFLDAYLEFLRVNYNTSVTPVDYRRKEAAARAQINSWVEDRTQGKIQNLLASPLDATTRLVLVNAVYFKGNWMHAFTPSHTRDGAFYLDEMQTVTVPLMRQTKRLRHHATGSAQILELPYVGDKISMLVMLPNAKTPEALAKLEHNLNARLLDDWRGKMHSREIIVTLPRFKITWGAESLVGTLQAMGIRDAFIRDTADFSGMDGSRKLFISDVVHKAFVDVNEQGTEAAAATAVGMRVTSAQLRPPPEFRADHPFLFLILENATGHILFMGRVCDPR